MVLIYLLLAHCLSLWYYTIFYWLPAYSYGELLSSTGLLPIPMVLYYLLLTYCPYLRYSTIIYWHPVYPCRTLLPSTSPTAYTFGPLLSSTGSLPIPIVVYYLQLAHCLCYVTLLSSSDPLPIFYRLPTYPYDTLFSSTGPLPIPMVIFYWLSAYTYITLLSFTVSLPIPMVLYYLLLPLFLYLW